MGLSNWCGPWFKSMGCHFRVVGRLIPNKVSWGSKVIDVHNRVQGSRHNLRIEDRMFWWRCGKMKIILSL